MRCGGSNNKQKSKVKTSEINSVIQSLASVLGPYPVAAYDRWEFGSGLIIHDGIFNDNDERPDSSTDVQTDLAAHLESPAHMAPQEFESGDLFSQTSSMEGVSPYSEELPASDSAENPGGYNHGNDAGNNDRQNGNNNSDSNSCDQSNRKQIKIAAITTAMVTATTPTMMTISNLRIRLLHRGSKLHWNNQALDSGKGKTRA